MRIDSHVHFWHYEKEKDAWITEEMKILQRDFSPTDIAVHLKEHGVDGCVAVQADQQERETFFLTELAGKNPVIKGVVGWVDLRSPSLSERLEHFAKIPVIKGWRHIVQAEPDDFLYNEDFRRGIGELSRFGYTYDILVYHNQLRAAIDLVADFPEQVFIIDHCAKPDIQGKQIQEWRDLIREIAGFPHISCKVSGLITEAAWNRWDEGDIYPYLDAVFEAFGPERLMFGSDWPVMMLSGNYKLWFQVLEKYAKGLDDEASHKFFGGNAARIYKL